jgi:hypothetical protein
MSRTPRLLRPLPVPVQTSVDSDRERIETDDEGHV